MFYIEFFRKSDAHAPIRVNTYVDWIFYTI
uniref:Uncharacterized protein n=1 Tax=Ralstonia syzygii R24 TaxID=907261 RepID=G2ZZC4_9RALS|nr:hypothetical protein RALSY_10188 [Ralstonia syzygii R24]